MNAWVQPASHQTGRPSVSIDIVGRRSEVGPYSGPDSVSQTASGRLEPRELGWVSGSKIVAKSPACLRNPPRTKIRSQIGSCYLSTFELEQPRGVSYFCPAQYIGQGAGYGALSAPFLHPGFAPFCCTATLAGRVITSVSKLFSSATGRRARRRVSHSASGS